MMKNITDAILDVQNRSTYLDALKAKYMLIAQDLMITIFSEDSMTPESEEEIQYYINELTSLKKKSY